MRNDRHPRVGDFILVSHDRHYHGGSYEVSLEPPAKGMVVKIERDKWGHQRNVFIAWQTKPAIGYESKHGFDGSNIHNLRSKFRIFRDGEEIR